MEDESGNYVDSDQIDDGTHNLSWEIYDLPEGYDYAFEWRVYKNGDMQTYDYLTFSDSGNITVNFSVEIEPEVCDLRLESRIYYLVDESSNDWDQISSHTRYSTQAATITSPCTHGRYSSTRMVTAITQRPLSGTMSEETRASPSR